MTSATQARGTINLSPASGTSKLYNSSRKSDMDLSRDGAAAIDQRLDGVEQLAFLVRLAEIVVDAELDGTRPVLFTDPRSDHHDRNILEARIVAYVGGDFVAVHSRHFDIEQYDVRQVLLQQRHGVHAVLGRHHPHAVAFEQPLRHAAHRDGVVDHQRECAPIALIENHRLGRPGAPFGAHQRAHVENDYDAAVAENRGAGDAADARNLRSQRFHDDFPAADQFIGDQGGGMLARADQHHRYRYLRFGKACGAKPNERAQLLEAVLLAAI